VVANDFGELRVRAATEDDDIADHFRSVMPKTIRDGGLVLRWRGMETNLSSGGKVGGGEESIGQF